MQNLQDFLTITIVIIPAAYTMLMILDLSAALVQLWNRCAKQESDTVSPVNQKQVPQTTISPPSEKPVDNPQSPSILLTDCTASTTADDTDTESLALLIQQLPQSRIRTAARRLGIADKVNGRYQRLAILRTQLKAKLKSQPMEVARVLSQLTIQTSTSRRKVLAS
jgi:hypothetical protein